MWKFISYNNLMYDKVQRILSDYEENGYIVEKVKFRHFFKLRKRKSNSVGKYIFVYHHPTCPWLRVPFWWGCRREGQ